MLRGAPIAAPDHKLYFGDYASIEARACAWAAGQQDIVELFARGGKIYEKTAAQIFGVAVEDVTQDQRFFGKGATLGCGFGMGAERFRATCKKQGRVVTLDLARKIVQGWRELNPHVVKFWRELEDAARAAVREPETIFAAGPFRYRCVGNRRWLQCRLPGGRVLWYRRPALRWIEGANGMGSLMLCYWGVDSNTRDGSKRRHGVASSWKTACRPRAGTSLPVRCSVLSTPAIRPFSAIMTKSSPRPPRGSAASRNSCGS
jgi:DNA polymerase bacteriophage-type